MFCVLRKRTAVLVSSSIFITVIMTQLKSKESPCPGVLQSLKTRAQYKSNFILFKKTTVPRFRSKASLADILKKTTVPRFWSKTSSDDKLSNHDCLMN